MNHLFPQRMVRDFAAGIVQLMSVAMYMRGRSRHQKPDTTNFSRRLAFSKVRTSYANRTRYSPISVQIWTGNLHLVYNCYSFTFSEMIVCIKGAGGVNTITRFAGQHNSQNVSYTTNMSDSTTRIPHASMCVRLMLCAQKSNSGATTNTARSRPGCSLTIIYFLLNR